MSDTIYRQEAIDAIYEHEFSNWCDKDEVSTILNDLPSADRPQGEYTIEDVAEILANAFGDECACNFNGIDEWLPFACKYTETGGCPQPEEKHGCWMQYLIQSGAKVKGADDDY